MKQSNFLGLNLADIVKGLLMAILTPVLVTIQLSVEAGILTFNWHAIAISAVAGGVGYIIKNLLSNSDGIPLAKERK